MRVICIEYDVNILYNLIIPMRDSEFLYWNDISYMLWGFIILGINGILSDLGFVDDIAMGVFDIRFQMGNMQYYSVWIIGVI